VRDTEGNRCDTLDWGEKLKKTAWDPTAADELNKVTKSDVFPGKS
jgi:hypothetical protein